MTKNREKELKEYASWIRLYQPNMRGSIDIAEYISRKRGDELTMEEAVFVDDLLDYDT